MLGSQPVANAEGDIAERPAASAVAVRYVWFSRDIQQYSISDGVSWLDPRACQTVVSGHMESRLLNAPVLTLQGYAGIPTERIEVTLEPDTVDTISGIFKKYTVDFTNQTSLTILGATHGIASKALLILVYNTSGTLIDCDIAINTTTYDVTLTFIASQSGYVVMA